MERPTGLSPTDTMTNKVEIENATLYLGDCRDVMPWLPKVDLVVTDPPYGIEYVSNHRKAGSTEMLSGDDDSPIWSLTAIAALLNDGGALYLATRHDVAGKWIEAVGAAGLAVKTPIYWDKGNHTAGDLDGDFGAQVEPFIFAHKGRHRLRGRRLANLWHVPRDPAGDHPTPKPVVLMERMIACSTDANGVVLDPFMGSGSTGVACANLGRKFIGIELESKYFDLARQRIEAAYAQGRLFA